MILPVKKFQKKRKGLPTPVCLLTLHQNWTQQTLTMLRTVIVDIQKRVTVDQLGVLTTMGIIHSFDLDLQVFIIILHHGCTAGIKIPLSCRSNNKQSRDIYTPDPVECHIQGHPQLHMQAQPQRHVQMHLQRQIPSHPQADIQVHPQCHMQAQPTHHIERYPEHDVTEKTSS